MQSISGFQSSQIQKKELAFYVGPQREVQNIILHKKVQVYIGLKWKHISFKYYQNGTVAWFYPAGLYSSHLWKSMTKLQGKLSFQIWSLSAIHFLFLSVSSGKAASSFFSASPWLLKYRKTALKTDIQAHSKMCKHLKIKVFLVTLPCFLIYHFNLKNNEVYSPL